MDKFEIETIEIIKNMKKEFEENIKKIKKNSIFILINQINFEYKQNDSISFTEGDINFTYEEYLHLFTTMKRLKINSVVFCINKCKEFMEIFNELLDEVKIIQVKKYYNCDTDEDYFEINIEIEEPN